MVEPFDHFYKLLMIGDQYTGKTSLLRRFTEDKFQTSYLHTIGIDFKIRTVELHGKKIRLQLWDTAGQERFKSITSTYYRGAQGVVLVYDIAERTSFVNIRTWFNDIRQYGAANVEKILVGNKCDMVDSRMVLEEEGRQLAAVIGARFIETSAKNNINVDRLFLSLVSDITARKYSTSASSQPSPGTSPNNSMFSPQKAQQQHHHNGQNSHGRAIYQHMANAPAKVQEFSPTYNPFQVGAGHTLKTKGVDQYPPYQRHRSSCCRYY